MFLVLLVKLQRVPVVDQLHVVEEVIVVVELEVGELLGSVAADVHRGLPPPRPALLTSLNAAPMFWIPRGLYTFNMLISKISLLRKLSLSRLVKLGYIILGFTRSN